MFSAILLENQNVKIFVKLVIKIRFRTFVFLYKSEEVRASKKFPGVVAADSGPRHPRSGLSPLVAAARAVPLDGLLGDGGSDCQGHKLSSFRFWNCEDSQVNVIHSS